MFGKDRDKERKKMILKKKRRDKRRRNVLIRKAIVPAVLFIALLVSIKMKAARRNNLKNKEKDKYGKKKQHPQHNQEREAGTQTTKKGKNRA
jgi:hypothetical protein